MVTKDDLLIPKGWVKAFGDDLCQELNKIDSGIEILDSKEKYGELRLVISPYSDATSDVEHKYTEISRHICISCGKPDVPMMNFGWISPVCKNCWSKFSQRHYDECVADSYRCPEFVTVKHYSWKDDVETSRIDLSDEMKKIRRKYKNESIDNTSSDSNADALAD